MGMLGGAFDQREAPRFFGSKAPYRPLAERADVLVFQTQALPRDIEVTGPIQVNLWISSSCPDTDFTAKLIDVCPPNPDLMVPGTIYRIRIDAFPTSNLFKQGHRIRIDISSSNFPHFDANPNTGEPEAVATSTRVATNRVYEYGRRPAFACDSSPDSGPSLARSLRAREDQLMVPAAVP